MEQHSQTSEGSPATPNDPNARNAPLGSAHQANALNQETKEGERVDDSSQHDTARSARKTLFGMAKKKQKRTNPEPLQGSARAQQPPAKVSRRARLLGGRRWRVTAVMAGLVVMVILTAYNTIAIASLPSESDINNQVATALQKQGKNFPSGQAASWAEQVVYDWATWDQETPDEHAVRMAQYLTDGMDPQAGWNEQGTQKVTFTSVNPNPVVLSEHRALVDVAYRLADNSRRCVTVPVYAYKPDSVAGVTTRVQWAFALAGTPTPRACAPRTGAVDPDGALRNEEGLRPNKELARELTTSFFPGFFSAWAASDSNALRQYTASGVRTIGLGGAMVSTPPPSIHDVIIRTPADTPPHDGTVYHATVPVTWTIAGSQAQIETTYRVPMKLDGERWYVAGEPTPAAYLTSAASGRPSKVEPPDGGASLTDSTTPSPDASSSAPDKED